ncbi:MAG: acyl-ACP thioesterase [Treponema sp.]|jgi:acyl-ACP thioesterase|nr:acyl-ACP thioesterase [Treponema sp.]
MDVWKERCAVGFAAVDESGALTMAAAFDYFQEAAIRHAENLGVGREPMSALGQGWVLSRLSVLLRRRPRQAEQLTVRTWPRGWERLFAIRDFDIQDETGTPVALARSCWLIVDMEKRRPLRPQTAMEKLPLNEGLDALADGGQGLDAPAEPEKAGERAAAYSDIDFNGHMNNARYVQWIQDILEPGALALAKTMRLDINYLREVKLGETLELWKARIPPRNGSLGGGAAVEGRRGGQAAFRAELRLDV